MNKKKQTQRNFKSKLNSSLHPLISILISVSVLTSGLFMHINNQILFYIILITIFTILAGNSSAFLKVLLYFFPIGIITALLSLIITSDHSQSIMTLFRFSIIGLSVTFTFKMDPTELSRALNQIGCPRKISLAILVVYSFIPVLRKEIGRIKEAMKVRGVNWRNPVNYYRVLFLPLIIRIIEISDTLALSIETRAFSAPRKATNYKKVYFRKKDVLILALIILATMLSFILF